MAYTDKTFLEKIKPYVMQDMKKTKILASLTAAQAFIESNKGNSGLTQKANNLFGIKGKYNGQSVQMKTTEYYNGIACKVMADFRKYPSWYESIDDHSGLFNRLARYKNLRGETDYVKACNNVKADGYATSPTYATTLIQNINKFKLYEWDREVLGKVVEFKPALEPAEYYPLLKQGSTGEYVIFWQNFLNASGYPCGNADGIFGKNTKQAVKDFQDAHGLKADGIIGPKTWNAVHELTQNNIGTLIRVA